MIGRTISHYRITGKLGEGGMGIVYKAQDTKLKRPVALKFLRSDVLEDEEHKERFLREAQAAAALDHPNICTVHEIDEVDGETFIAMAYLEGQTVKRKVAERPLKLDEALDIAIQTAQGLQAAHEKGIVHRDIKGANLMVTPQGQVKIMDFGLAQLAERSQLTKTATILGTPAYMSPEQARRERTDRRTDIWSLGVVIYEMVTGRLPFEGERQEAVLYAIAQEDPEPITALRVGVPTELDFIVSKAMAKDAGERYQHVEEMIVDLRSLAKKLESGKSTILRPQVPDTASGATVGAQRAAPERSRPSPRKLLAGLSVALAVAVAVIVWQVFQPALEAPLRRFAFTPESLYETTTGRRLDAYGRYNGRAAISPNGRHIVYVAGGEETKLWVRDLDREEPRELAGTEGAVRPFWSPDSQFIGFGANRELKKISAQGGPAITLCPLPEGDLRGGGGWSPEGDFIAFGSGGPSRIYEVPAQGGKPRLLFEPEGTEKGNGNDDPHFLPLQAAARSIIFDVGGPSDRDIAVKNLETGEREVLAEGAYPVYSPSGHIVYQTNRYQSGLWALPFSIETLKPTGEAFSIRENVSGPSVGADGTLVYLDFLDFGEQQLVWRDRGGKKLGVIGQPQETIVDPTLSPDGGRVVVWSAVDGNDDIWVHEVDRPLKRRLIFNAAVQSNPIWSPSGKETTFESWHQGNGDIYSRPADGTGEPELLAGTDLPELPNDWSPDGKYLLYRVDDLENGWDLWYLKRKEDGSGFDPVPFLQTSFNEHSAKFSAQGRFVTYVSDQSGQEQVYVRSFPEGDGPWQVSTQGGEQPRWSRDGKELFYVEGDTLMAVEVSTSPSFTTAATTRLFQHSDLRATAEYRYDVSADGQRFVLVETVESEEAKPPSIHVVQNWFAEFRDRGR